MWSVDCDQCDMMRARVERLIVYSASEIALFFFDSFLYLADIAIIGTLISKKARRGLNGFDDNCELEHFPIVISATYSRFSTWR